MRTDVVVIGGGQAGLAMSRCLSDRAVDHVVLERARVAHAWRTQRWDSLRLLTPNWMTRLPGFAYAGPDPEGYLPAAGVVDLLEAYRRRIDAPVVEETAVTRVAPGPSGHRVESSTGAWDARAVVVATGGAADPSVPAVASDLPTHLVQLPALSYRNPAALPEGEVLVVGASASGVQIADEVHRSGRPVTLAVGEHVRVPRTYRDRDIHWWMDVIGLLDERYDEVPDIARARRLPSLQLVGSDPRRDLDLRTLQAAGVTLTGRLAGVDGTRALCSGSLPNVVTLADLKAQRLLDRIDAHVAAAGWDGEVGPARRLEATPVPTAPTSLELDRFTTVIWATGHRPRYDWLDVTALDGRGQIVHDGGVGAVPGLYVLGLPFTRRRKSNFIDGVGPDARDLADHLVGGLAGRRAA